VLPLPRALPSSVAVVSPLLRRPSNMCIDSAPHVPITSFPPPVSLYLSVNYSFHHWVFFYDQDSVVASVRSGK
jgi:hypothetical protein